MKEKNAGQQKDNTPNVTRIKNYLEEHYQFRRNIVANCIESRRRGDAAWGETNENNLIVELLEKYYAASERLLMALLRSDFVEDFDPFRAYFEGLPAWDESKPDHIGALSGCVKVDGSESKRFGLHFRKALVRMVACALGEYVNKHAIVLIGKQNDGKTTFCRFLVPPALSNYQKEHLSADKDGRLEVCNNFLINLDELAALSKNDIHQMKYLFSTAYVKERPPYDRRSRTFPRRASFIGSTNQDEFLADVTGSVRWLCFRVQSFDFSYSHRVDIDLVYAQAYRLLKTGFDYKISAEELDENEEANKEFRIMSLEAELIQKHFASADEDTGVFKTPSDILEGLHRVTSGRYRLDLVKIGKALRQLGFERKCKRDEIKKLPRYGYYTQEISF